MILPAATDTVADEHDAADIWSDTTHSITVDEAFTDAEGAEQSLTQLSEMGKEGTAVSTIFTKRDLERKKNLGYLLYETFDQGWEKKVNVLNR